MAKDPYRYFRVEARELLEGLTHGILQLEKGTGAPDRIASLLRLGHTLKGAARVVKQPEIAERAHVIEGILASHEEAGEPLSPQQGTALLRLLDEITSRLDSLGLASDRQAAIPTHASADEPLETLRVDLQEMDLLLRGVTETSVQLGVLRKGIRTAGKLREAAGLLMDQLATPHGEQEAAFTPRRVRARALAEELRSSLDRFQRSLDVDVDRVSGELAEIGAIAHRLRLIPARTVFPSLDRAVRDAAQALGKRVDFAATGGEVHLDANVLSSLRDALTHVVRNAVAHGIEAEPARLAAGKSPTGHVRLDVERRGSRVSFVCRDDGRGVDVEAVRRAAVARGLVSASAARSLPADTVIAMLRTGGLTTSDVVSELSGRGIGLDVVRATTARLKGELSIRSETGRGVAVEVQVPVSIASLHTLVVEAGGTVAAIPLDAVRQTLRVTDGEVARTAQSDSIVHDGAAIPFLSLDRALRRSGPPLRRRRAWSAVVVQAGDRRVAIGVDALLGTSSVVLRPLPRVIEADPVVSGVSLDADGNPQLVLDPSGLVAAAVHGRGTLAEEAAPARPPVLVIDDSLTTRMLEQSILESAGYSVELAVSAEDALAKARDRRYSLFIVDVEMPGMSGFEFVAQTRADTALRDVPAILVTSRNAVEDRRLGAQVGARAYIVKGEFDQGQLLDTIRTLIG